MLGKVIDLINEMALKLDKAKVAMTLKVEASAGNTRSVALSREIADRLPNCFLEHHGVITCLIDTLMNDSDMESAERLFERSKNKSVVSYGAMLQSIGDEELIAY
jgi:hypothetical protein